jgi:hypothetical protein
MSAQCPQIGAVCVPFWLTEGGAGVSAGGVSAAVSARLAQAAPAAGRRLWAQLSLRLIRFPERIPTTPERVTDGVTFLPV